MSFGTVSENCRSYKEIGRVQKIKMITARTRENDLQARNLDAGSHSGMGSRRYFPIGGVTPLPSLSCSLLVAARSAQKKKRDMILDR